MSTNIYTEKEPLLPLNHNEVCQRNDCQGNQSYNSKYRRQGFFFILFVILFTLYNGYQDKFTRNIGRHHNNNNAEISNYLSAPDVSEFSDIVTHNENQINTYSSPGQYFCHDKPEIPFTGLSKFEFSTSEFPGLKIDQKIKNHRRRSISLDGGEVNVLVDESVSQATVEFDLKFNDEKLQDIFWIEQTEDKEKGTYSLTVKNVEDYDVDACATIDVTVRVPKADDLQALAISFANSGVTLNEGLIFQELGIDVANGHISFPEGITSGKIRFGVVNGHISGTIDTLSDGLHASIANGNYNIAIKEIDQSKAIPIKLSVAGGHIDLQVPSTFESTFRLTSLNDRCIEAHNPVDIHFKSTRGTTTGYYGSNAKTKNSIGLTSSTGHLRLNYA